MQYTARTINLCYPQIYTNYLIRKLIEIRGQNEFFEVHKDILLNCATQKRKSLLSDR
jgi:hypothetical protein